MSEYNFAAYRSATGCDRYGPAGAQAVSTYLEDRFPTTYSLGICSCRSVAGGSTPSHHGECRAHDRGVPIVVGGTVGIQIVDLLARHGKRLGIDHIIYNLEPWAEGRGKPRIWSATAPDGRVYTGAHPHKDHPHIGLTRGAGVNLTYGTLVDVLGDPTAPFPDPGDDMTIAAPSHGRAVRRVKKCLNSWHRETGHGREVDETNNRYGPSMSDLIAEFQQWSGLPATGEVDGVTFSYLTEWSEVELETTLRALVAEKIDSTRTWTKGKIAAALAAAGAGGATAREVIEEIGQILSGG